MSSLRYTFGTEAGRKKKNLKKNVQKKRASETIRDRVSSLLGRKSNGSAAVERPPQHLYRPSAKAATTPMAPRLRQNHLSLKPEDRALIEELVALLKRSLWGDPEVVEDETPQEAGPDDVIPRTDEPVEDQEPA